MAEGLFALAAGTKMLIPGDEVELAGLPGLENQRMVLRGAVYRRIGHRSEPTPVDLDPAIAINEELDSRFVRVTGTLLNAVAGSAHIGLKVQGGNTVFGALLERAHGETLRDAWSPGSRLALTGVYRVETDEGRRPLGFQLQLRSPADVTVLAHPSWWTPQRALGLAAAFGVFVILGFERMISLCRRVRAQTEQIREQLVKEATLEARNREIVANASDFIFTIDREGRFTSFNPAGERMTGYTCAEALQMNIRDVIAPEDAGRTAALWMNHGPDRAVIFQSRLRGRDGRIIWTETSSRMLHEAVQPNGMPGVVRDICERKQVEQELERARDAAEANTQARSAFLANMNRKIVAHDVVAWKMRCDVAADAREALTRAINAAAAGDPYRLPLLDLDMPGMDGVALADANLRAMPMILLRSLDRRFLPEELTARGFTATLTKPVSQPDLLAAILRMIGETVAPSRDSAGRASAADAAVASRRETPAALSAMRILVAEDCTCARWMTSK